MTPAEESKKKVRFELKERRAKYGRKAKQGIGETEGWVRDETVNRRSGEGMNGG